MPQKYIEKVTSLAQIGNLPNAAGIGLFGSAVVINHDGLTRTVSAEPKSAIYVDPDGAVKTIAAALALVTATRKNIYVFPGTYVETAQLTWPSISGVNLQGLDGCGNVVISGPITVPTLTVNPTCATTFEMFLQNVVLEHTAQVGLEIDNELSPTKKVIVHLNNVGFSAVSTGNSIHVTHTGAAAIRIYAKNCNEIEGLVLFHGVNVDDRVRFYDSVLIGGVTIAEAVAMEFALHGCIVLTGGLAGMHGTVVQTISGCVYRTDAGVYTELANAYSA
jgi:hypothetical protein